MPKNATFLSKMTHFCVISPNLDEKWKPFHRLEIDKFAGKWDNNVKNVLFLCHFCSKWEIFWLFCANLVWFVAKMEHFCWYTAFYLWLKYHNLWQLCHKYGIISRNSAPKSAIGGIFFSEAEGFQPVGLA